MSSVTRRTSIPPLSFFHPEAGSSKGLEPVRFVPDRVARENARLAERWFFRTSATSTSFELTRRAATAQSVGQRFPTPNIPKTRSPTWSIHETVERY